MIGHKLPNKTKSATVAELKKFHQLNRPLASSSSGTLTTQPHAAAPYGQHASTPTAQFVQSICNTTGVERVHVVYCYDVLVDEQESFKGSHIMVIDATIRRMAKDLGSSSVETRKFNYACGA
jgi:hypothetical protein